MDGPYVAELYDITLKFKGSSNPVSYTHLDVYKRQVKENKMAIEYKRLTEKELNIFINMRINQLREEGAKEEIDLFPALKEYYRCV